jgi:hypothetical protein
MQIFSDFQSIVAILLVGACALVLLRRAGQALRGESAGCGTCPQKSSPQNSSRQSPGLQTRQLAQITLPKKKPSDR